MAEVKSGVVSQVVVDNIAGYLQGILRRAEIIDAHLYRISWMREPFVAGFFLVFSGPAGEISRLAIPDSRGGQLEDMMLEDMIKDWFYGEIRKLLTRGVPWTSYLKQVGFGVEYRPGGIRA